MPACSQYSTYEMALAFRHLVFTRNDFHLRALRKQLIRLVSFTFLTSVFQVVYVVLSLCVGLLCELKFGQEDVCTSILGAVKGDSAILFGKVFLWVLVLLFTACAQHHHSWARSRGYLRFYRQMQGLKYLPIHVHSAGTSA